MTQFNWIDYSIIGIMLLSMLTSFIRGCVREVFSLVNWGLSIWVAYKFAGDLQAQFGHLISNPSFRMPAAYAILFFATLLLGSIINYLLGQLIDKTGLSSTDRVLGIVFGAARGALVISLLLMVGHATPAPQQAWWKHSVLIPSFQPLEQWLHKLLPEDVAAHFELAPGP